MNFSKVFDLIEKSIKALNQESLLSLSKYLLSPHGLLPLLSFLFYGFANLMHIVYENNFPLIPHKNKLVSVLIGMIAGLIGEDTLGAFVNQQI